jgi:gliding motility-associated-like protein
MRNLLNILLLFAVVLISQNAYTQVNCTEDTPFFTVDLTGNPGGTWTSPAVVRDGSCCGGGADQVNCIELSITLDPGAEGIIFNVASGANPGGALYFQVNCIGVPVASGSAPICLDGVGPHLISYCKVGNNTNTYSITSVPAPASSGDVVTADGCQDTLSVSGLTQSSITWTSIPQNGQPVGYYNNYLNNLAGSQPGVSGTTYTGQSTVIVTPQPGYPPNISYQVCGSVIGGCSVASFCDTVTVSIFPTLFAQINPLNPSICFGSPGTTLTAVPIGGTAPYTYLWNGPSSNGATTSSILASVPGVYTLSITDATGCPAATTTVTVTQFTNTIVANAGPDIVICRSPVPTIAINGTVTGVTTGIWSGGAGTYSPSNTSLSLNYTPTAAELAAGTVTLTLTTTNNGTCPGSSDQVTISLPQFTSTLSAVPTNITCNGLTNGSIDLTVTGGAAPSTYSWTNGASTQDITGLGVGSYTVTVADVNGCIGTLTQAITQPTILNSTITAQTNVSCFGGNNASVTVAGSGGTAPYQYALNGGANQASGTFSGLAAGSYTVTVTDAQGCITNRPVTITQPATAFSVAFTQTNVLCFGASTGAINVTSSGGTAPYTYSWSNGATTEDLSSVPAGTYTLTANDANGTTGGCAATLTVTITQPAAALTLATTQVNVLCFGGITGSVDLTPSGGTAPYTYSWSNGAITQDLSGVAAGTYTVNVTDANGISGSCAATASVTITQPLAPLSLSQTQVNVLCFGGSNGSINLTPAGGTTPYSYAWSNGFTGQDPSGLIAGTYTVVVTDANGSTGGCTATSTVTITQPAAAVSASTTQTNVLCFGGTNGAINLTPAGGTVPYTYAWSNGATTQDLSGLSAGTYTVIVNDANGSTGGCTATTTVTITQPAAPLTVTNTSVNVLCNGGSNGSIDITPAGGTAPYTYLWSNGATTQDLSGLSAGTYTVNITDANGTTGGCNATTSITITQPVPLTQAVTAFTYPSGNNISCFGLSDGSTNLTIGGGTPGYTYLWSNGAVTEDLSGVPAGTYNVVVTDLNGCTINSTITLNQPAVLNSTVTPAVYAGGFNLSGCVNDGSIDLGVSGGSPGFTYLWSNGSTTQDISSLAAGTYSVTITDLNGCQTTNTVTLTQPNPLTEAIVPFVYPSGTNISCFGLSDGSIDLTIGGGSPNYTYLWSNGATTQDLSNLPVGTYNVTVTDANGCQITSSITLTQPVLLTSNVTPSVYAGGFNVSGCVADGTIDLTVAGGNPGYTYLWSNGATSEDVNTLIAGTYIITVTDLNGCTSSNTITLTQPGGLTQTISSPTFPSGTNISCFGLSDGAINLTIGGGTPGYTYLWSNGATTEDLSNVPSGTYGVTVTDANGCQILSSITLIQPTLLTQSVSSFVYQSGTNISCFGENDGSVDLVVNGGNPTYSYVWSNGATTQDLTGLVAGTYTVTITDLNGCSIPSTITLTEPTLLTSGLVPSIFPGGFNLSGCNPDGAIDLTVAGGNPGYTYSWSNGSVTQDLSALAAGAYTVTVTDINGCQTISNITLTQPPVLTQAISAFTYPSGSNISCFGASDGSIDLTIGGGVPGYTYNWSNGASTQDLTGVPAGTYNVSVSDQNGCIITSTITLTQPPALAQTISAFIYPSGSNISCFGASDGSIDFNILGGNGGYTYLWSNGATTEDLSGITAGTYSVIATDANGCSIPSSFTLIQPLALSQSVSAFTYPSGDNISCFGFNDGSVDLSVDGGSPGYTYLWSNGSTTEDISSLAAGTYTAVITDLNGCIINSSITLVQPTALTQNISAFTYPSGTNISCFGLSDGSIDLTVNDGSPGYTYVWSNGAISQDLTGLTVGTYNVTITDLNGCILPSTITLTEPPALNQGVTAFTYPSGTNISCFGLSDGSIDLTVGGGNPGYTYLWNTGSTLEDLSGLPAGNYSVVATDVNGCTIPASIALIEPTILTELISSPTFIGGNNISCFGFNDGSIDLTINGGNPGYTYLWNNGAITQDITALTTGTYDVTVTDLNGCQITSSIILTEPTPMDYSATLSIYPGGFNVTGCADDGSIDLSVSGSIPGYFYVWSNGAPTEDISDLTGGDYTVTINDANGCQLIVDTTLTVAPLVTSVASVVSDYNGQDISCIGASDGSITVVPGGGVPGYVYQWASSSNPSLSANQTPVGLPSGLYSVTVTDVNGCTSTTTVTLVDPPAFNFNVAVSTDYNGQDISCFGASDGGIDLTVSGATPAYSYAWTDEFGNPFSAVQDPIGLPAGTYNVLTTDLNGCTFTTSITLTEPDELIGVADVTSNYNGEDVSCYDFTDGSLTVATTGGTAGYSYQWTNSSGNALGSGVNQTNVGAGIYQVQITDVNGCTFIAPVVVTEPEELILAPIIISNYFGQAVSCEGATDGIVNAYVDGGIPAYSFSWNSTPVITTQTASTLGTGTYTVTVTDLNGCSVSDNVTLTANPNPVFNLPPPMYGCIGNPITVDANADPGNNCQWTFSNGIVINDCGPFSLTFDEAACLDAQLIVSTTIGCIDTVSMTEFLCVAPNPVASFTIADYELTTTNNGTFFYNNSEGADSFLWNFGDESPLDNTENPFHSFPPEGYESFEIWLYAISEFGCLDSTVRYINMSPELIFFVPNTFTPDDDQYNNTFYPVMASGYSFENFNFMIFNRWGELIYESNDINSVSWDGTYSGKKCQEGVYTWKLQVMNSDTDRKEEAVGHVSLLRGAGID